MRISVLITTYNRAEFLRLCLLGYLQQSERNFELVVSDDGSADHTWKVVDEFRRRASFPVRYVWQPDGGHRRALAINRAIAAARSPWLLFTDSDSIPARNLVAVHRQAAEPERLLCGGRVLLSPEESEKMTSDDVLTGRFEDCLTLRRWLGLWRMHLMNLFHSVIKKRCGPYNYGFNMSCSMEAMARINGYDHNLQGRGNADGDVRDRMRKVGIEPKSLCNRAFTFHQWHQPDPTLELRRNKASARRSNIPARCKTGLDSLDREEDRFVSQ